MRLKKRFRGAMLGLAACDAVGTTLEFMDPGTFEPITDMVGGGSFELNAGEWTDDTSMALCLAASLVECFGFDAQDQIERYVRWWRTGYMSSNGRCFDIGNTVKAALAKFEADPSNPYAGSTDPYAAGNGSIMRLAPVPLAFFNDPVNAVEKGRRKFSHHTWCPGGNRCLPLHGSNHRRCLEWRHEGRAALGQLRAGAGLLGQVPSASGDRHHRGRFVQDERAACDQGFGLFGQGTGSRALGFL